METNTRTEGTQVEVAHGNTVQQTQKKLLGELPKVAPTKTEKKQEHPQAKYGPPLFKAGDQVYAIAFLRGEQTVYYVCRCVVEKAPEPSERRVYKVKITAVAAQAIGQKPSSTPVQATLLNRVITKRENELNKEMASFMMPKTWILAQP